MIIAIRQKLVLVVTSVLLTATLIYLTPLKHLNIIEPTIDDIAPKEFYELYQKNPDHYIFLDVRGEESYNRLEAVGSKNQPLHTLYNERHNLPKRGKEIVFICSGGIASGVAYSYLEHYGFFNIKRVAGGIENWVAQGLPVESSETAGHTSSRVSVAMLPLGGTPGCPSA